MKFYISFLFILLFNLHSYSIGESDSVKTDSTFKPNLNEKLNKIEAECLGVPYKWGGENKNGFDCSGFVKYVFKHFGIELPHSSKAIAKMGTTVKLEDAKKGDLLIFTGYKDKTNIGHIGIIMEHQEDKLIFTHSSSASKYNGVVRTEYYNSNYPSRLIKVIRIR